MTSKLRMLLVALAAVGALALVACGGDDDGDGNGGDGGGDFVAEANEICNDFEQRFSEFENASPTNAEEASELISNLRTGLEDLNEELGDLSPETPEQEEFVNRFDELVNDISPLLERFEQAIAEENTEEIQSLGEELSGFEAQTDEIQPLAEEAGLEGCGEESEGA